MTPALWTAFRLVRTIASSTLAGKIVAAVFRFV